MFRRAQLQTSSRDEASRSSTSRSPRARRGSAFIEALAVISLFIALFGCAARFGQTYAARIVSGQRARASAWTRTAGSCGRDQQRLPKAAEAMADAPNRRNAQAVLSALHDTAPEPSIGTWTGLLPWHDAKRRATSQTQTQFSCNELPASAAGSDTTADRSRAVRVGR